MIKKATPYTAVFLLMIGLFTACSGTTPTSSTVNIPNVQNGGKATATAAPGAYPAANTSQSQPNGSAYPAAVAAPLTMVSTDGKSTPLSPAALANIPTKSITVGTKNFEGISVASILTVAGIKDYKQITFIGANGSQILTKDKVDGDVILNVNKDGSLQLVSPNLTEDQWLKSVNTIKAE